MREKKKKNHLGTVFILAKMDSGIFQKSSSDCFQLIFKYGKLLQGNLDFKKLHSIFKIDFDKAIESDDWIFPYFRLANFSIVKGLSFKPSGDCIVAPNFCFLS